MYGRETKNDFITAKILCSIQKIVQNVSTEALS